MAQLNFLIIIPILTVIVSNGLNGDQCDSVECFSSLTQSDCGLGEVLLENSILGCCPGCKKTGVNVCDKCDVNQPCSVGLRCEGDANEERCVFDKNSCHHLAHMNPSPPLMWKPECYASGIYKEKQCRGDKVSGRCFCFGERGQKIFGWDWRYNEEGMTCACSRHRSKLERTGHISTLHCQQNGNYEELQCDAGVCFCAETTTGKLQDGTRVLPDTLWTKLPCYNKSLHGDTYLRQCESMAVVQKRVSKLFELHGTKDAAIEMANCNYDGSYGLYKLQGNEVKCIWRDGKIIEPFSGNTTSRDCACAIDQKIYEESNLPFKLTCTANGMYQEAQIHQNGKYYCVDALGYAISDFESDEMTKEMCDSRRYDRINTDSYCSSRPSSTTTTTTTTTPNFFI